MMRNQKDFKVLLVDDNKGITDSLSMALHEFGYKVIICQNGKEAINILESEVPEVILSDVKMPYVSGFELLSYVNKSSFSDETAVILFTGYGDIEDAVNAMKLGAFDYLLKPLDIEDVCKSINKAYDFIKIIKENKKLKEESLNKQKRVSKLENELEDYKKLYNKWSNIKDFCFFSDKIKKCYYRALEIHKIPEIPVLIEGETGTGKEVFARIIHHGEDFTKKKFVAVNCASINPNLFESEIFGYTGGSFTGGKSEGQIGKIQLADGGTLLFDEVTEMSLELQAKLLRLIQEKEYYQVGGLKKINLNTRLLFTTNRNIEESVRKGFFREDLYYRIRVANIKIPPLRDRPEDIMPLSYFFLNKISKEKNKRFEFISQDAEEILLNLKWKGNVRELKNTIETIVFLNDDYSIKKDHFSHLLVERSENKKNHQRGIDHLIDNLFRSDDGFHLDELNKRIVEEMLKLNGGNKSLTAQKLGLSRTTLYTLLKKFNL